MGSYEVSPEHAVASSIRMIQDGRVEVNSPFCLCSPMRFTGVSNLRLILITGGGCSGNTRNPPAVNTARTSEP